LKSDLIGAVKNNEIGFFDAMSSKIVCLATFWRFVFDEILYLIEFLDLLDSLSFCMCGCF